MVVYGICLLNLLRQDTTSKKGTVGPANLKKSEKLKASKINTDLTLWLNFHIM